MHSIYPHEPGRLPGCPACDLSCNCNHEAVDAGRETVCVWLGHEENERQDDLAVLSDDELADLAETAAAAEHDAFYALQAIEKVQHDRILRGIAKASDDG